jgi:hypothetical protein
MRSKHYGNTPMSWLRQLAREIGVVSVLSISLIGNAYGQNQNGTDQNGTDQNGTGQNRNAVPEIATGAAISAFLLAGGSLLLLSDRIRKKKSTS